MSFSSHRRDALDLALPLPHRQSHARSCAMLMGQKYRVHRSVILELVHQVCATDLIRPAAEAELVAAVRVLERIKAVGLALGADADAEPVAAADRHVPGEL